MTHDKYRNGVWLISGLCVQLLNRAGITICPLRNNVFLSYIVFLSVCLHHNICPLGNIILLSPFM
jgi:hypothetical protein